MLRKIKTRVVLEENNIVLPSKVKVKENVNLDAKILLKSFIPIIIHISMLPYSSRGRGIKYRIFLLLLSLLLFFQRGMP